VLGIGDLDVRDGGAVDSGALDGFASPDGDAAADVGERDGTGDSPADSGTDAPPGDTGGPIDSARDVGVDAGPIAYVQGNAVNLGGVTTGDAPFLNPVTAGSALVVAFDCDDLTSTAQSVTDTLGNTFNIVQGPANGQSIRIWTAVALDSPGGDDTVTITLSSAPGTYFEVYLHEYSGIAASGAVDVVRTGVGVDTSPDAMRSGLGTTTFPHELVFGFGVTGSAIVGTGFTGRTTFDGNVTEDKIVTSVGSYETFATANESWIMAMVTLRGR